MLETPRNGNLNAEKWRKLNIHDRRWNSKIVWKRWSLRIHFAIRSEINWNVLRRFGIYLEKIELFICCRGKYFKKTIRIFFVRNSFTHNVT